MKIKISTFKTWFAVSPYRNTLSSKNGPAKLLPGNYTLQLSIKPWTVPVSICGLPLFVLCILLASSVLRYLLLCLMPFQLTKAFIGTLPFQRARKPLFSWSVDKDCPRKRHGFGQGSSLQLRVILGTWLRTISCPCSQQLGNNRCLRHAGETGPHLTAESTVVVSTTESQ